jgi:TBC1 domain family protein 5
VCEVIEANYSIALMLLLKYPAPSSSHGPQTFVEDAIYLRDNFSAAGGSEIIAKYSGKSPPRLSSLSRPSTPLDQVLGHKRALSRTRTPLSSPARFLQQQGGVEALLSGAARGVFDRGERLGINQAVRDAVGEVKKNMQGLQSPRPNSVPRRTSDVMRWSLDEGRSVASSKITISAMNKRNLQLSHMLDQAMAELRSASVARDGDKDTYVKAMDLAIAKVEFVKIYLEDSTMPLPVDEHPHAPSSPSPHEAAAIPQIAQPVPLKPGSESRAINSSLDSETETTTVELAPSPVSKPVQPIEIPIIATPPALITTPEPISGSESDVTLSIRPKPPVPTRSTIANSSFSWMLEPDASPMSSNPSSPPKSGSPFLKSGRKPTSGPSREKAAFLFGDDGGESSRSTRPTTTPDIEEGFKLGTIRSHKGK